MRNKVILITGEQGFLGALLMRSLKNTFSVTAFDGDVTDIDYCIQKMKEVQPDVLIHLAALSLPKQCDENPELAKNVNIVGTKNITYAASMLDKDIHFIFTSTAQVYDYKELSKGFPVDEKCKIDPQNLYAETKRSCEIFLEDQKNKLNITILRLFNHVHKSQKSQTFMSSVYEQIQKIKSQDLGEATIVVGDLDLMRELNPVQSLIEVFHRICAMSVDHKYEIFNVCSGVSYKLESIAEAFAKIHSLQVIFKTDKSLMRNNDARIVVGNCDRMNNKLNILYPRLTVEQAVSKFCEDLIV